MGFLEHDTNNIILDAVLTDLGRQFLSRNDGSFSIVKFALSDDEIDYTLIKKYGRTVGKEKIEKNTPVFEALTNANQAQKFRLTSVSIPTLIRLPVIALGGNFDSDTSKLTLGTASENTAKSVVFTQSITSDSVVPPELIDQVFTLSLPHLFVEIQNAVPDNIDINNVATYRLRRDATLGTTNNSSLSCTLGIRSSVSTSLFNTYSVKGSSTQIRGFGKIVGMQSGSSQEFEIVINKE
jgi:hypothetical protein